MSDTKEVTFQDIVKHCSEIVLEQLMDGKLRIGVSSACSLVAEWACEEERKRMKDRSPVARIAHDDREEKDKSWGIFLHGVFICGHSSKQNAVKWAEDNGYQAVETSISR